ncbi:hypothetical protein LCGC14_0146550 [marine sediment metagenome]|uniref:Uncharacterized protein n=1 Tax=marine sediment metagenome TaxID=412755 RepID=A0A0F9V3H8_9ZZZZ
MSRKLKGKDESRMDKIKSGIALFIVVVVVVVVIGGFAYLMFQAYRHFNYAWGYESMVQETVTEMVKPECLLPPESE